MGQRRLTDGEGGVGGHDVGLHRATGEPRLLRAVANGKPTEPHEVRWHRACSVNAAPSKGMREMDIRPFRIAVEQSVLDDLRATARPPTASAPLWHQLMTEELGYVRFGAHGGDWGSTVTEHLGRSYSRSVVGMHLTDVPFWHAFQKPKDRRPPKVGSSRRTSASRRRREPMP